MSTDQITGEARNLYLKQFQDAIAKISGPGKRLILEAALRNEQGTLVGEGPLNLPLRIDGYSIAAGQTESLRVDSATQLSFEPTVFKWRDSIKITVRPFCWDACGFRISGIPSGTDWVPLKDWFNKWFDIEDSRTPGLDGLSGVIHFLSDPILKESATTFQVDFGSAPSAAFDELLDALLDLEANEIMVGS